MISSALIFFKSISLFFIFLLSVNFKKIILFCLIIGLLTASISSLSRILTIFSSKEVFFIQPKSPSLTDDDDMLNLNAVWLKPLFLISSLILSISFFEFSLFKISISEILNSIISFFFFVNFEFLLLSIVHLCLFFFDKQKK